MYDRFPTYAPVALALLLAATAACNRTDPAPTSPASADSSAKAFFAADPRIAHPDFLTDFSCTHRPAFSVRVAVIGGGGPDIILRQLRFVFIDRFNARVLPHILPGVAGTSAIPTSTIIPIPGVAPLPAMGPIPIPGSPPVEGLLISRATQTLPFFVRFGCDLIPDGTLLITGDLFDRNGRDGRVELRVEVQQR